MEKINYMKDLHQNLLVFFHQFSNNNVLHSFGFSAGEEAVVQLGDFGLYLLHEKGSVLVKILGHRPLRLGFARLTAPAPVGENELILIVVLLHA